MKYKNIGLKAFFENIIYSKRHSNFTGAKVYA